MWPFSKPNPEPRFPADFAVAVTALSEEAPAVQPSPSMSAKSEKEQSPAFRRLYTARLGNIKLEISARSYSYGHERLFDGCLTQPNGNRIFFDPRRIADKILDPALVPLIADAVNVARSLDAEFVRAGRVEFVDDKGVTWRRGDAPLMLAGAR
jgi:hypothetical protein